MTQVRILLRWFLLATAVLALATCAPTAKGPDDPGLRANPCNTGAGKDDRHAPIVCVDDLGGTLSVNPDPINVHDEGRGSGGRGNGEPVIIHWWTRSGTGDLGIQVADGCVTDVNCRGAHCMAKTLPKDGSGARCKYDVWTAKHPRLDPEIIIVDCCAP